MSDPLTLGMGQTVTQRIRRLNMRPTKLKGQLIATAVIIAGLGGTASITTYASATSPAETRQKFMIKMVPDNDKAFLDELQRRLEAVRQGEQDESYVTDWKAPNRGSLLQNHIYAGHADTGQLETFLTDAEGKRVKTDFEAEIHEALAPILKRCETHSQDSLAMLAYSSRIDFASNIVLSGPYITNCYPGSNSQRASVSADVHIAGLMASTDLPIESRLAKARGLKAGELRRDFEAAFPTPNRQQYFDNCIKTSKILNEGYRFHNQEKLSDQKMQMDCETNTVRNYPN